MAMHYNEWEIKGARLSTKAELLWVIRLEEEKKLKPLVSKTFPFEKANEALQSLQQEDTVGRLVLTFSTLTPFLSPRSCEKIREVGRARISPKFYKCDHLRG